ncbi:MAG: hypothetical protein DRI89_05645 [Bacteroidetes bacterium]|nr:MAG: hypothetical protein DRI89_05645 [Bacteroidota bacterium]
MSTEVFIFYYFYLFKLIPFNKINANILHLIIYLCKNKVMTKKTLIASGFLGLAAILLLVLVRIAFYSPDIDYAFFNTAITLHIFHTIVLLGFAFKNQYVRESRLRYIYYFFVGGIVVSCTPLYIMLFEPSNVLRIILTSVSIIGSGLFIGGWITIVYLGYSYKSKYKKTH